MSERNLTEVKSRVREAKKDIRKDLKEVKEDVHEDLQEVESNISKIKKRNRQEGKNLSEVKKTVEKIGKNIAKEKGEENLYKGKSYEDKIRTKIKIAMGKEGLFRAYQAVGEINSVNLSGETKGKKKQRGYEVDAYGTLQKIGTKKKSN